MVLRVLLQNSPITSYYFCPLTIPTIQEHLTSVIEQIILPVNNNVGRDRRSRPVSNNAGRNRLSLPASNNVGRDRFSLPASNNVGRDRRSLPASRSVGRPYRRNVNMRYHNAKKGKFYFYYKHIAYQLIICIFLALC